MVRFTSIVLLATVALSEARLLKRAKTTKNGKATGMYKASKNSNYPVSIGSRPYYILDSMADGDLKDKLTECAETTDMIKKSDWSIGHRGAAMQVRKCFSIYLKLNCTLF